MKKKQTQHTHMCVCPHTYVSVCVEGGKRPIIYNTIIYNRVHVHPPHTYTHICVCVCGGGV